MRILTTLVAALALALAGCGDDKQDSRDSGGGEAGSGEAAEPTTPPQASAGCENVEKPAPKEDGGQNKPKADLDPQGDYRLRVETNCGSFTIALDPEQSPQATASLVNLARDDFFSGTTFHRIVPGFVIQGGDPTGTGTGGPGYSTRDTPPDDAAYTKGVVAMAKAGDEPPGAAGSQFYVVTGEDAGLPPEYAIVGKVSDGMDTVDRIGRLGDASEQPTQPVVIETITVEEG